MTQMDTQRPLILITNDDGHAAKGLHKLIALMRKDKKNATADAINFTLLKKAGDPIINQVAEPKVIEEALDYLFSL